jgi:hypothetical protein
LVLDEVIHASEKKLNIENLIPILIQRNRGMIIKGQKEKKEKLKKSQ